MVVKAAPGPLSPLILLWLCISLRVTLSLTFQLPVFLRTPACVSHFELAIGKVPCCGEGFLSIFSDFLALDNVHSLLFCGYPYRGNDYSVELFRYRKCASSCENNWPRRFNQVFNREEVFVEPCNNVFV